MQFPHRPDEGSPGRQARRRSESAHSSKNDILSQRVAWTQSASTRVHRGMNVLNIDANRENTCRSGDPLH